MQVGTANWVSKADKNIICFPIIEIIIVSRCHIDNSSKKNIIVDNNI